MTPSTRHFILATAGHVDHGKSALVKALTGIDPTHLPEERARGITIELGFAHLKLPHPREQGTTFEIGVIDVPGHEDFVKNMVAGIGSIDIALLVVAADDGWMPQTEEHLQILDYLAIPHAIVVLSKIDLAPSPDLPLQAVRQRLDLSRFKDTPIVPVSTLTGQGLDALRDALTATLAAARPTHDVSKPRLWVDRALSLRGVGTVVTGTLSGGTLRVGDTVMRDPGGAPVRIRAIQTHGVECEEAGPARRVALSLPELEIAERLDAHRSPLSIRRGDLLAPPEFSGSSDAWDVSLVRTGRTGDNVLPEGARHSRPSALKHSALVRIHHGSSQSVARVHLAAGTGLAPGEQAIAQLRFETPQPAFVGDRFVVRDWTARFTLAGGTVLSPAAPSRAWREPTRLHALERRAARLHDPLDMLATELILKGPKRRESILVQSAWTRSEIETAIVALLESKACIERAGWLIDDKAWSTWLATAEGLIDAGHKAHPERPGEEIAQLRAHMGRAGLAAHLFEALRADLPGRGFTQTATHIRRREHRPELPPQLKPAEARIRASLAAQPLEPPPRRTLVTTTEESQALAFLVESGQVVEITTELVFLAEEWTRATLLVKGHLRRHTAATVSQLREVLQTSRRVIVPVLERLDRDGITVREGDLRRLKPKPSP